MSRISATTFESIFTTSASGPGIRLFGASDSVNLFRVCCERYGETRGNVRVFSLTDTLLLYATLVHRIHGTEDAVAASAPTTQPQRGLAVRVARAEHADAHRRS